MKDSDMSFGQKNWREMNKGLLNPVLKRKGYRIHPFLTITAFLIIIVLFLIAVSQEGIGTKWSFTCPENARQPCYNQYHPNCGFAGTMAAICAGDEARKIVCADDPIFCTYEYIQPGQTFGHIPGFWSKYFLDIMLGILILTYTLNHFMFNTKSMRDKRKRGLIK